MQAGRRRARSSRRSPRTTARSADALRSSRSHAGRWTLSPRSSVTATAATSGCATGPPGSRRPSAEMVEDGITRAVGLVLAPQFSALSVARYQQRVADGLDLYRGRIEFEHVSELSRRTRADRGVRRQGLGGALALAGSRARPRSRRLHRAQPPRARPRERGSVRGSVPGDRRARRGARRTRRRPLVVELPVRRPHARSPGPAPISASI